MINWNPKSPARPWFNGEVFEQVVVLLMTLVVIQTAVVTYWLSLADDSQGDAGRDAQIFAIQGLGARTEGSIRTGYDQNGAYQRWLELNTQAAFAEENGDTAAAERYLAARDEVARLSPMLQPPYFDSGQDILPDISGYTVDTYLLDSIILSERFTNQYNLKAAWYEKANTYLVHITILAVALFLFGLSTTTKGQSARLIFVITGAVSALFVLVWMLIVNAQPVKGLSDEAIQAYAEGVGYSYRGDYEQSIQSFNRALQLEPQYLNAVKERALSYFYRRDYEAAAQGFEQALRMGERGTDVAGNLGWVYYLLGRFDDSIAASKQALALKPNETWIRANYALALLVSGRIDQAQAEYDAIIQHAANLVSQARSAGQEPPADLWWALDASAADLDYLLDCYLEIYCPGNLTAADIVNPDEAALAADNLRVDLKQASVALENTGALPGDPPQVQIGPFNYSQYLPEFADEQDDLPQTLEFPSSDEPLYVLFSQQGLIGGEEAVVKVQYEGEEDARLRVTVTVVEDLPEYLYLQISTGGLPLYPGEYRVELYINSYLVQEGYFYIVE